MNKKTIYPGTFDPITNGHLNIVTRAATIFQNIILAIADNPSKKPIFSIQERVVLATKVVCHLQNVVVMRFSNLLVDFAQEQKAFIIIRGLRTTSDWENEKQIAEMNHNLYPALENVFLMPMGQYTYLSSSLIKEIFQYGGDVTQFLPSEVYQALKARL
ncbi:Phosphopantetheine adenylyltransferase [Candidatus Erwinia haradaeae]|uniref:Phosphopantetheine adenylyltransferase n=1 Tax=Candidatus Erwinia haradaeae TaxID=1922217 RepID=A0A451DC91_9GAMM|nr:pantetheine-phosphate adenylyltransferase [Candidatus Erwinia haradaeae]VFP84049.1 Phosphopantetheine adenylyltransferase [Candidatus Erwinia haradaeae]